MRVTFLDFDGVLLPIPASGQFEPSLKVSTEAINCLNILVQLTGADVVVTSAWRIGKSTDELEAILRSWGYKWYLLDKTLDNFGDEDRGADIVQWLSAHFGQVESFVVIDDDPTDLDELAKSRVMPKPDVGLQFHDVQEAIRILNG